MGSLETWTIRSWPRLSTSWMGGAFARRPSRPPRSAAALPPSLGVVVVFIIVVVVIVVRLVFGKDEIGRVQERALLRADVDERRLNARKNRFDSSEVDVADHAAGVGTVDQELNELVVLEDGDPRFSRVRVDQNFSFHRCPRTRPAPGDSTGGLWRKSRVMLCGPCSARTDRRQHAKGMSEASGVIVHVGSG